MREGSAHHKRESELFKRRTLARFHLENAKLSTNVSLSHCDFEFYGMCDVLIVGEDNVYPVEIKLHGDKPTKSQKIQLIAYGMLSEAIHGKKFDMGFVLFEKNGKTVPIKVVDDDKREVEKIVSEIIGIIVLYYQLDVKFRNRILLQLESYEYFWISLFDVCLEYCKSVLTFS